mgnify:CR=1 FL=1
MGANKRNLSDEQRVIADELDKIQIDQLHKATLNFSNNSLETKKIMCHGTDRGIYVVGRYL